MNIYEIRKMGREFCQTEGSEHYKTVDKLEPIDLIIAKGLIEDFCLANIIKYASRFKATQNLDDLKKVSDYSHILCGCKIKQGNESDKLKCDEGFCTNKNMENNESQTSNCKEMMEALHPELNGKCPWRKGLTKCL